MKNHPSRPGYWQQALLATFVVAGLFSLPASAADGVKSPWNFSFMGGRLDFEGDEAVADAFAPGIIIGYDLNKSWTLEGVVLFPWKLDENFRVDWETGREISRLEESAGVHETSTLRLGLAGLYHLAPGEKVDPYLTAGGGIIWYGDDFVHSYEGEIEAGAGVLVKLLDSLSARADGRVFFVGTARQFNSVVSLGLTWSTFTPAPVVVSQEKVDTDRDRLADVEETTVHRTDPLNPDSDWDGLSDGDEVMKHHTDPLKRDTDGGGVADGHEVIEDTTNPLEKGDDLEFYELHIEYAADSAEIAAQYYGELDVIGKILADRPGATARIEGHIDQRTDSKARQALRLTGRRAEAVRDYLAGDKWKIGRKRLTAVGYGYSRPQEKPDLANGNSANRRIEIYIRRAPGAEK